MQDERLVARRLDQARELWLLGGWVDVRITVVLKDSEEPIEPNVDTRRLDHRVIEGVE
jgi:hypothetical protein